MANKELATAIRQVKSGKEYHFALSAKGGKTQLAMDKRKVSGEDIAQMKKAAGGGNVVRGTCTAEDGTLIFSSATPPVRRLGRNAEKVDQGRNRADGKLRFPRQRCGR